MKGMKEMGTNGAKRAYETPSSKVINLGPYSHLMQVSQIGGGGSGKFDVKQQTLPFDEFYF